MAKFKVGDKVKIREDLKCTKYKSNDGTGLVAIDYMVKHRGEIHTIVGDSGYLGNWRLDGLNCSWSDDMLEAYEFTKADLKDGMVVEFRNNPRCPYMMVVGDELRGPNGWCDLADYNDDLKCVSIFKSTSNDLTIDKVYTSNAKRLDATFNPKYFELVWDRPCEIEYIEMTVEEIEKQLGHKIKVVGSEGK